jgi:hypothetical protein
MDKTSRFATRKQRALLKRAKREAAQHKHSDATHVTVLRASLSRVITEAYNMGIEDNERERKGDN